MNEMPKSTRKHGKHIRVPVLPDEEAIIKANAEASGLSAASFIRKVAMGYEVASIVDIKQVLELSRVNGDLGRLGGLLKLWLANDPRTANFPPSLIKTLLRKVRTSS